MSTIRGMLRKAIEAKQGIEPMTLRIVSDNKELILDLNRETQLAFGTDTKGNLIGTYSRATEQDYGGAEKGKFEGEPYNFQDEGDFFKGFNLEYNNGRLRIFSTDSKTPLLTAKYKNLIGLVPENEFTVNYEIIKPHLVKYIKQTLRK